jgi:hypothetical protein
LKGSSSTLFAILPSGWLCSTSGANLIESSGARQHSERKKIQRYKELTGKRRSADFARPRRHARMRVLFQSFPMVNQA